LFGSQSWTRPNLGKINTGQNSDGQGQPAEQHQPPPGGRIVTATVNKDNQQELDHCEHPEDRGRSPALRPAGPPGAQTQDHRKHNAWRYPVHDAVDQLTDREEG
jgi:hypothetical protein